MIRFTKNGDGLCIGEMVIVARCQKERGSAADEEACKHTTYANGQVPRR